MGRAVAGTDGPLWQVVKAPKSRPEKAIIFTDFIREVEAGKLRKVTISGDIDVEGEYRITAETWISVLINASPFLLLLAFWLFMMRQMKKNQPRSY